MHRTVLGVLILFCSVTAAAGTITSINPTSIGVRTAEHFLVINGSQLGTQVTFTGPAGTFVVNINSSTATSVTTWVPLPVVNTAGTYSVSVSGSNSVNFSVIDPNRRFVLLVPEIMLVSAFNREGSIVKYDIPWWTEERQPEPPKIDCFPASGSQFKFGLTRVDCTAVSYYGERDQASFSVNVLDDVAPELRMPTKDIVVEQTEEGGAVVKFDTAAFDNIDGELRVSCTRSSGTLFPVGRTLVSCNANDFSLNTAAGSFFVEVRGKGRLALNVPANLVFEADGPEGSVVEYEVEAYGTEDPNPRVKCDPPSGEHVRIGATAVYCFAEDRFGQTAEAKFELNVVDTLGPVINVATDPQYLVPVDGSMVSVGVFADPVDLVDPFPQCTVTGVTANEEISLDDWKIVSDREVALRARISGKTDRIYRIAISCYDANRNESSAIANVIVPASGEAPKPGSEKKSAATGRRRAGGK